MATIAAVTAAALGAPVIAPFDPTEQFFAGLTLEGAPLPPVLSPGHFLKSKT